VLVVGVVTALATWLAGTLLGIVAPGSGASAPTALAVVVVIVVAVIVVGRVLGRSVGPLASIADAAERLADGEPDVRVEIAGPGPVRRLGASFNAMAERLDRSRSDRQALLADVTHELRTPLQVIGGSTEAMLDGVHPRDDAHLAPIRAETAVMNRLLDDLRRSPSPRRARSRSTARRWTPGASSRTSRQVTRRPPVTPGSSWWPRPGRRSCSTPTRCGSARCSRTSS
jgi:signal transduction histidine kinase